MEFLQDLKGVIVSPARRFALIYDRGSVWGSLALMLVPAYFGSTFAGGVYFDRDPIPGYSFLVPALLAILVILVKLYPIHLAARLMEGRGKYSGGTGTFRGLLSVIGYASLPQIIAGLLFLLIVLLVPEPTGSLFRNFHIATLSVLIAIGVALFIWVLILSVHAMRRVYCLRDLAIIAALLIGTVVGAIPLLAALMPVAGEVRVNSAYVRPILSPRIMRLFADDPVERQPGPRSIQIHLDRIVYRFHSPERFDIVVYGIKAGASRDQKGHSAGRILGLPGETIELAEGALRINGRLWEEPYILPEFRETVTVPATLLGREEYFVCPENRKMVELDRAELVVRRDRIHGRAILNKWPIGWCFIRPTAFLEGHPAGSDSQN